MGKIVLEHYPAEQLPEELRGGLPANSVVCITIEEEHRAPAPASELVRKLKEAKRDRPSVSIEEAVARIRTLRDEWDDR